jgi:hypothetical protein
MYSVVKLGQRSAGSFSKSVDFHDYWSTVPGSVPPLRHVQKRKSNGNVDVARSVAGIDGAQQVIVEIVVAVHFHLSRCGTP